MEALTCTQLGQQQLQQCASETNLRATALKHTTSSPEAKRTEVVVSLDVDSSSGLGHLNVLAKNTIYWKTQETHNQENRDLLATAVL